MYHAEVSFVRKPWSKSIQNRVQELFSLDIPVKKTVEQIAIPYATIMSWKKPRAKKVQENFHSLTVRPTPTVTVKPSDSQDSIPVLTVTARTPEGYILEIPESIAVKTMLELQQGIACF